MAEQKPYIGGQAVLEGVMMRAPRGAAIAVRRPDGTLAVREGPHRSRFATSKLAKLPGFRGVFAMVEALSLGYRALQFSAEQQMTAEERASAGEGGGRGAIILSTLIALGLFMALPQALAAGTGRLFGSDLGVSDFRFHLLTGGFKLLVFTGYLLAISQLKDVKRLFQYHGAEHKTIFAYEAELPLTLANVRAQSTLHPRCGTTFLVVVVVVSILLGSAVTPLLLPGMRGLEGQLATLALRIALLPAVAAISFELQRFSARYCTKGPLRVVLYPGFLFQKITTREPDDAQLEVAITAMRAAIWRENVGGERPAGDEPLVFPTFAAFEAAASELRPAPELKSAA